MRIPRVYLEGVLDAPSEITVEGAKAHYLLHVLRIENSRPLTLFNGDGFSYSAQVIATYKKSLTIEVLQQHHYANESPLYTHLALAISRGERMDWAVQKATELGVSEITPIFTERCEVKLKGDRLQKKIEHWRQVSISACEQSGRNKLPVVNDSTKIEDFIAREFSGIKWILVPDASKIPNDIEPPKSVTLLIGPEGGLSEDEIELATLKGFRGIRLGPRVLRTETAPIAALSLAQYLWGDWQ